LFNRFGTRKPGHRFDEATGLSIELFAENLLQKHHLLRERLVPRGQAVEVDTEPT